MEVNLKNRFPGIFARERSKRSHYWLVIANQAVSSGFVAFKRIVRRNAFQTAGFVGDIVSG
jgi:hypothetical protein